MPDFANPFSGNVDKVMTERELIRALRLDIASEEEAINMYEAHVDATDNVFVKKVLQEIADEERVHVGEIQELLNRLLTNEENLLDKGATEVEEFAFNSKNWYKLAQAMPDNLPTSPDGRSDSVEEVDDESSRIRYFIARADAFIRFIADKLGIDPKARGLIVSLEEAVNEDGRVRTIRNAKRKQLRDTWKQQKFNDWGGLSLDSTGKPLSGNAVDRTTKKLNEKWKNYENATINLVFESGSTVSDDEVEQALYDALMNPDIVEEDTEDVFAPTYDGTSFMDPGGMTVPISTDEGIVPSVFQDEVNTDNAETIMQGLAKQLSMVNMDYQRIIQQSKIKTPTMDAELVKIARSLLDIRSGYEKVVNISHGVATEFLLRIAQNKILEIDDSLILVGYPNILQ